ncbi:unnamed protein product (macronuclear) [Paramecium tetraurelia]|uniref:Uncharacterized protein n=1 Tax=Paramecium tetraurelia TaxID=5888 RepID=A0DTU1_PARTE|nr:uncharacterized protein GSPATT00020141001 [Paramecium tetraurelia]CAK86458.1 unnamed protein product [Paramecium tetraurelia]|eukprot:XP_001453855.1 hypothetical protein (macronuclear) [Paramecium tetraurelia strain d4-2]
MSNTIYSLQEFRNLDVNSMIQAYDQGLQHINELQIQIEQLEKSAIDIIVEKDQMIEQLELQLQHSSRRPSLNNQEEVSQYKNHIQELQTRLEHLQTKHYEQLQEQEKVWNQYLLDQIAQNEFTVDQKLKSHLEQIFILEDKINKLENELEIKENMHISLINQNKQFKESNSKLEEIQITQNRQILRLQIEIEQLQSNNCKEKDQFLEQINNNNQELQELLSQTSSFKIQNQKLNNQNKIYTSTINELMVKKAELELLIQTQKYEKQESIGNGKTGAFSSIDQQGDNHYIREDINTTAFDINEDEIKQELASFQFDENNVNFNHLKKSHSNYSFHSEKKDPTELENHLKNSIKTIRQLNAQVQLLTQQIKIQKRQSLNQKNAKEYLNIMEQNYKNSVQLKQEQMKTLEDKLTIQNQEIVYLKQKVKQYTQKLIKYNKRLINNNNQSK